MLLAIGAAFAQPKFEVASIKPSLRPAEAMAAGRNVGARIDGAQVDIGVASLALLIKMAYRVEMYQISGPDWMATERFDILAKIPDGATKEQVPEMLQALLADRFKLVVRRESKEEPVFALLVDQGGPKLKESPPGAGSSDKPFPNGRGDRIPVYVLHTPDGVRTYSLSKGVMIYEAEKITLPELALVLMPYFDIPVIDMTGLKGWYQVAMDVPGGPNAARIGARRGDVGPPSGEASVPSGVSTLASVQKLGLRLEKRKALVERIVVEHLEKAPTEN
jgi:uncharacterized protein (TIGR03435 family)